MKRLFSSSRARAAREQTRLHSAVARELATLRTAAIPAPDREAALLFVASLLRPPPSHAPAPLATPELDDLLAGLEPR